MKKFILGLLVFFFIFSCKKKNIDNYLELGLENYRMSRNINQNFIDNYGIDKVAFYRIDNNSLKVVLKMSNESNKQKIDSLSLGAYVYVDNKYIGVNDSKLDWNTKPVLRYSNNHKYIIDTITIPNKTIDSLVFYLYDRDSYKRIIGTRIYLKNIKI
ncbi:hypothetical protein [Aequorivita sp. KMM 9714]|uniref:hypothetical protein n=1 Tax=Aequorivita sp. KMM 9714 TaxID=2707173 RepID=UPI0013EAD76B|nr:hypothetical protein [Aequorivita sp. KMM 9714]NGX83043.1 hypothetical protein [Aequorivita sp. KMM 9714]